MKDTPLKNNEPRGLPPDPKASGQEPPRFDPDEYRDCLDDCDLSEEQQNELLGTLWHIMRTFVEIGFGLDSVQMFSVIETDDAAEKTGRDSANMPGKKDSKHPMNKAAFSCAAGKEEGHD